MRDRPFFRGRFKPGLALKIHSVKAGPEAPLDPDAVENAGQAESILLLVSLCR
jgi:hypothetical protein